MKTKRNKKQHKPFIPVCTIGFVMPISKSELDVAMGKYDSALVMVQSGKSPGRAELRDLCDVINIVETMARTMHLFPIDVAAQYLEPAIAAMVRVTRDVDAGGELSMSDSEVAAISIVLQIYRGLAEFLPRNTMAKAARLTDEALRKVLKNPQQFENVVMI